MTDGSVQVAILTLAVVLAAGAVWIHRQRAGAPRRLALLGAASGAFAVAVAALALFRAAAAAAQATGLADMQQAAASFGVAKALFAVFGVLVGAIGFWASLAAIARMRGWPASFRFRGQRALNLLLCVSACLLGTMVVFQLDDRLIVAFLLSCMVTGIGIGCAWPVALAGPPLAIPLCNGGAGLALVLAGLASAHPALVIAGLVVGSCGILGMRAAAADRALSGGA